MTPPLSVLSISVSTATVVLCLLVKSSTIAFCSDSLNSNALITLKFLLLLALDTADSKASAILLIALERPLLRIRFINADS